MLASQSQRGLADPIGIGMREIPGCMIVGRHAVRPTVAKPFPQVSYGARGKVEGGGEAGGRLPLLGALE
jgi:hypothetical protein